MERDHHINLFRRVLEEQGAAALIETWRRISKEHRPEAIEMLNDPDLPFPALYVLKEEVEKTCEEAELDLKNRLAFCHIDATIKGESIFFPTKVDLYDQQQHTLTCLRWMVFTGGQTIVDAAYLKVIDHACTHLLMHDNDDRLRDIIEIIFYRHRVKAERHYLLWAFYEAADPRSLHYVASFLNSNDETDNRLAKKMLRFIPGVAGAASQSEARDRVAAWLEVNGDFLWYTGETNDANPYPIPFIVLLPAKYLGQPVEHRTGQPLRRLLEPELERWREFETLPYDIQHRLADASCQMRYLNFEKWREWMNTPVQSQVTAITGRGFGYDYR
ncbi:hypothetical protein ACFO4N_02080 [Camelliibacillus cellulosilyticus]|uniref:Uncharacterized protein n=1 Tax=Camelliibacillus cellulosilyticus TaxID=2174486 RepID=A0ABV9GLG3_9BACL